MSETVTEPGVFYDMPAEVYHAQKDWLSWSSMKHLLPPKTPAHFKAAMAKGEEHKRHFDVGKVVHALTLGEGDEFVVVQALDKSKEPYDADGYTTVSARAHRDAIYAEGKVPILRDELEAAKAMADSVRAHRTAHALLSNGRPEVSLFWIDPVSGVKCRCRVDWLPNPPEKGRRMVVPDLKSAVSAAPTEFSKAAANFGYYGQHTHYLDGIRACFGGDPAFVFVTVEKEDPHLVSVGQFDNKFDIALARAAVDHCRLLYRDCMAADQWPGYGEQINDLSLPFWLHSLMEEALA